MWLDVNNLSGSLPASLGQLTQLQSLIIWGNPLSGPLPASFSQLTRLQYVDLHGNYLNGPLPTTALSQLHQLNYLDLGGNQFSGTLPFELGQLTQLKMLSLAQNQLSGSLLPELSQLTNLQQLNLSSNKFEGPLPVEWSRLTQLQGLGLGGNKLSGTLPPEWSQLTKLEGLDLSNNSLDGQLPAVWGQLRQLYGLSLAHNQLSGSLPSEWCHFPLLSSFDLSFNKLSGTLPSELNQLTQLFYLNLSNNQFNGSLPTDLSQLSKLGYFILSNNQFSGPPPIGWRSLTQLRYLYLSNNQLSGILPSEWSELSSLSTLDLSSNQLSGSLPPEWNQCSSLRNLTLSSNHFSGTLPSQWAQGPLGRKLSDLNISHNDFSGQLPSEWGRSENLYSLDLSYNQFNGVVPVEWGEIEYLGFVSLAHNNFRGSLPEQWGKVQNFYHIDLDSNQFSQIPSWQQQEYAEDLLLRVSNNKLDFRSLEPNFSGPNGKRPYYSFDYIPQAPPSGTDTVRYSVGDTLRLTRSLGGRYTHYQWEHQQAGQWVEIAGANDSLLIFSFATTSDSGRYRVRGTNDWATDLTLYSKMLYAQVSTSCPTLTASRPSTIQIGDAVSLQAYAQPIGTAVQWRDAAGTLLATTTRLTVQPTQTTTYTVTPAEAASCPDVQATVTVTVVPAPPLANPPTAACSPNLLGTEPAADSSVPLVNYVRTYTAQVALPATTDITTQAKKAVAVQTQYLDGLGRPVQTVQHQAGIMRPDSTTPDLVQPMAYDALGRQPKQYLPYAIATTTANYGYHANALWEQYHFYTDTPYGPSPINDNVALTGVAYSEQQFEASPRNRVIAQAAPGETWRLLPTEDKANHTVRVQERPHTKWDGVLRFTIDYTGDYGKIEHVPDYAEGALWLKEITDENGHHVREFTDKQGLLLCKQVEDSTGSWLQTYYVYDDFNHLRAVLPPKAIAQATALGANYQMGPNEEPLLFRYRYDGKGRVIGKKVPGQDGEMQFVYDQLDRVIMTQDARQRAMPSPQLSWNKYDQLGRIIMTGIADCSDTFAWLQSEEDRAAQNNLLQQFELHRPDQPTTHHYTISQTYPNLNDTWRFPNARILTVSYYDDYDFDRNGGRDSNYDARYQDQFSTTSTLDKPAVDLRTKGLVTRTKTRVLEVDENDPNAWLTTTFFYNERSQPIQIQSTNVLGGTDVVTSQVDFLGREVKSYSVHTGPNHEPITIAELSNYDHAGRLITTQQQLGSEENATTIASYRYNALGQLINKTLSPDQAITKQSVDYTYTVRGWLKGINEDLVTGATPASTSTDLWGMQLSYECGFRMPEYNGNVSGQKWRSRNDGVARAYGYLYDGASRLKQADYVAQTQAGTWSAEQQRYGLLGINYDKNGNIRSLQRRGLLAQSTHLTPKQYGLVDDLAYSYAYNNRLQAVEDRVLNNAIAQPTGSAAALTSLAGDFQEKMRTAPGQAPTIEYNYDANGNLKADKNKGITSITYNHLDLPTQVNFSAQDFIEYRYTASGEKVAKLIHQAGQVQQIDYVGPYQYEGDSLRFFNHPEGRVLRFVSPSSAQVRYVREYTIKDHLGSLRIAYRPGDPATYWASMEPSRAELEEAQFDQASIATTRFAAGSAARTATVEGSYVAKLNAAAGKPIGPLLLLPVHKGDVVDVLAPGYAPHPVPNGSSFSFSLLSFVTTLLQQPMVPPGGETTKKGRSLPFLGLGLGLVPSLVQTGQVPKGYVRALIFDQDSALVDSYTQPLTAAALSGYEELRLHVQAPQDGYMQVYVGNESALDVLFDDVQVDYKPGLLVQENQYDPWGLALNGINRDGGLPINKHQYIGQEKQEDLNLNWTQTDFRMYDPQLGRFHQVDPLADIISAISPYQYAFNNPTLFSDPSGLLGEVEGIGAPSNFDDERKMGSKKAGNVRKTNGAARPAHASRSNNTAQADATRVLNLNVGVTNSSYHRKADVAGRAAGSTSNLQSTMIPAAIAVPIETFGTITLEELLSRAAAMTMRYGPFVLLTLEGDTDHLHGSSAVKPVTIADMTTNDNQEYKIALGVDDDLANFSMKMNFIPYMNNWAEASESREAIKKKIIAIGMLKNTSFHFNLHTNKGRFDDLININSNKNATTRMEYFLVRDYFPHKTTFYRKSGTIYKKEIPNYKAQE
ncbi:hypothetical protein BXP70_26510 [Hymenobacter crusticola]|uniref:Ig-like domain-containing protein n=1 Tax=Hymenobacter crusticola TaxID=1770526 RepID=A0A243W8C0_9BACT|nr:hypothetical protein BXP70_26510 [Hymenobacter crusticola]